MKPDHIQFLCSQLEIGSAYQQPYRVYGGFHHKMWHLETDSGIYAVKQLSTDTDVHSQQIINHYNLTESVAETFARHHIQAVHALNRQSGYLQVIENTGYLVYPWSTAVSLKKDQISEKHALKIAHVLAKMHQADIQVTGIKEPEFDIPPEKQIREVVQMANEYHAKNEKTLQEELPNFIKLADSYKKAVPVLARHTVISHGDLDQKNVLWDDKNNPVLIDWENARKLNPTYEILLQALDWSGITTSFNRNLYEKIMNAYQQAGGKVEHDILQASFDCILGDWANWLTYNISRSINFFDEEQRKIGTDQVDLILPTIKEIQQLKPKLI